MSRALLHTEKKMENDSYEPKKLALIRIYQILKEHSDIDHPMTQEDLRIRLHSDYGIDLERKAISRNLSLLKEAGFSIESDAGGNYLDAREFENTELRLLIDSVICNRNISPKQSKSLIDRLCGLSNKYFKSHIKHIYSLGEWSKTENATVFWAVEQIDEAIEKKRKISFIYATFGADRKFRKDTVRTVSPHCMIIKDQYYHLIAVDEEGKVSVFRLDRMFEPKILTETATDITSINGYENGFSYRDFLTEYPFLEIYGEKKPEHVKFVCREKFLEKMITELGDNVRITPFERTKTAYGNRNIRSMLFDKDEWRRPIVPFSDNLFCVSVKMDATNAMELAVKYPSEVMIVSPAHARLLVKSLLINSLAVYEMLEEVYDKENAD